MTQFMKKYMIQTLYMDAWDLGTFSIGEQLFLGVSQLGGKSFVIYKWDEEHRYIWLLNKLVFFNCVYRAAVFKTTWTDKLKRQATVGF